jgi:hypothetical protein
MELKIQKINFIQEGNFKSEEKIRVLFHQIQDPESKKL